MSVFYQKGSSGHPSRHHDNRVCTCENQQTTITADKRIGSRVTLKQIDQEERVRERDNYQEEQQEEKPL